MLGHTVPVLMKVNWRQSESQLSGQRFSAGSEIVSACSKHGVVQGRLP
jgi:hypothetical protein